MDDWTTEPIQPAYNPGDAPQETAVRVRKLRKKPPTPSEAGASEDILGSDDDPDEHEVDCFARSMMEDATGKGMARAEDRESLIACLGAWKELHDAIARSCEAMVRMDLESIRSQFDDQERLCASIRRLETRHGPSKAAADRETHELLEQLAEWKAKVHSSNRIQEQLLTHSSRLVKRLSNALVRFFPTYPEPGRGVGPA